MANRRPMTPEEKEQFDRETKDAKQLSLFDLPDAEIVYGYIRVSSKGQAREGYSLEAQETAVRKAGASKIIKDVYSGVTTDRPSLEWLLNEVKDGDMIIVTKFDRLARNLGEGIKLIEDLNNKGVKVKILEFGDVAIDNSPTGQLIRNMMLCFAQFERDRIMERTREGKEIAKKDPNYREGRPPKYTKQQIDHALQLLSSHSYSEVEKMTGISKSTLIRARKNKM